MDDNTAVFDDDVTGVDDGEELTPNPPAPAKADTGDATGDDATASKAKQPEGDDDQDWRPEFDERTQKFIDERIVSPKISRMRETQRELEEARRQLDELRARVPQDNPDEPPVIPPVPDAWADDYEAKLKERDEAVRKAAQWEIQRQAREHYAQQQQAVQQQEQAKEWQTRTEAYAKKAGELGVSGKDLELAGKVVIGSAGVDANMVSLVQYILEHESGPLITMHLAENIDVLEDLRKMSPMRAAAYIEKTVAPKAARRHKPPPPPPPTSSVRGSAPGDDPMLKGAVFD